MSFLSLKLCCCCLLYFSRSQKQNPNRRCFFHTAACLSTLLNKWNGPTTKKAFSQMKTRLVAMERERVAWINNVTIVGHNIDTLSITNSLSPFALRRISVHNNQHSNSEESKPKNLIPISWIVNCANNLSLWETIHLKGENHTQRTQ